MPRWSTFDAAADRRLVQRLNEGDDGALGALYDAYAERLLDYALSLTADQKAASDIVHDAFIDAFRRAPRMRDHVRLRSWLYAAARRRCLQRGRAAELYWEPDGEFAAEDDQPFSGGSGDLPPTPELAGLLAAVLKGLESGEQEAALLAVRHGLAPAEAGIVLGVSSRTAAARVARSRTRMEGAYQAELGRIAEHCPTVAPVEALTAAGRSGSGAAPDARSRAVGLLIPRSRRVPVRARRAQTGDPRTAEHNAGCAPCRRRAAIYPAALLALAPAPVLPAALRHRVTHTATDPELAGYRADIAARGGGLTPDGLPSQPDSPSPFTRRWLFAGGGMVGALATALIGTLLMGQGVGTPTIAWPPFRTEPQPSITQTPDEPGGRGGGERPGAGGGGSGGRPPFNNPQQHGRATPSPSKTASGTRAPRPPGVLSVSPARVELYGKKTGRITVKAASGPVAWKATDNSGQVTLSRSAGSLEPGATDDLTLTLRTFVIGLPGAATVTFTDPDTGRVATVEVVWGISVL